MIARIRWHTRSAIVAGLAMLTGSIAAATEPPQSTSTAQQFPAQEGWKTLFNGKDLTGWIARNPRAKKLWVVCDQVRLDPVDPGRLLPVGTGGSADSVLVCGEDGRGSDIMTEQTFGDYQLDTSARGERGRVSTVRTVPAPYCCKAITDRSLIGIS